MDAEELLRTFVKFARIVLFRSYGISREVLINTIKLFLAIMRKLKLLISSSEFF